MIRIRLKTYWFGVTWSLQYVSQTFQRSLEPNYMLIIFWQFQNESELYLYVESLRGRAVFHHSAALCWKCTSWVGTAAIFIDVALLLASSPSLYWQFCVFFGLRCKNYVPNAGFSNPGSNDSKKRTSRLFLHVDQLNMNATSLNQIESFHDLSWHVMIYLHGSCFLYISCLSLCFLQEELTS